MASALWLGSMEPQRLSLFLSLPVQVMVTPVPAVPPLAGQRFFTPQSDKEALTAALLGRDIYFLAVTDWQEVTLPPCCGTLLAIGETPPPAGSSVGFIPAPPAEQYAALCRLLPPTEPETLYISGGEVRCSVVEEDFLPLIERLGSL